MFNNVKTAVSGLIRKRNQAAVPDAVIETVVIMGVRLPKKPVPAGSVECKRCHGTGEKVYISKAKDSMGEVKTGQCFNCHGVGSLTADGLAQVRQNYKDGKRTIPVLDGQQSIHFGG
ncbi:MAG: hypothetical protein VW333_03605 [Pseudomonadales bacterium]